MSIDSNNIIYQDGLIEKLDTIDNEYSKKELPRAVLCATPYLYYEIIKVGYDVILYKDIYYAQIFDRKNKKTIHKIFIGREDLIFDYIGEQKKYLFKQNRRKSTIQP